MSVKSIRLGPILEAKLDRLDDGRTVSGSIREAVRLYLRDVCPTCGGSGRVRGEKDE